MTEAAESAASDALILNVNDAEGARYLVSHILRRAGFDVIEAGTGEGALARIAADAPDLVVLDVRLPDIDGIEVCRRVRETPRERPIKILHTSATYIDSANRVESLDNGADGYLVQPFEPEELVATVRSLLRLNDAEQELLGKTQELREADRRKDEFLAMLAHELRNPLAAISASLPVLERREPLDDVERHARDVLERQVGHLARLVNDLLDMARVTQGKIELHAENIDLVPLLRRVADQVLDTRFLPRRQTLRFSVPKLQAVVVGDVTRLEQIFSNLLDNASKYT
ncbi:MAG TPA: hybrid sensor histidine kinase/response regulator, partial [Polyangiaceae bacterium]